MKKTILIFLITTLFSSSANSQTDNKENKITGDIKNDLTNLLSHQKTTADIMDGVKISPRLNEISVKFQNAIRENYEWFQEYMKTAKKGEALKYHPNFGVTEEEYNDFLTLYKNIEIVSTGKEEIQIIRKDSLITFKGANRLTIYNNVTIDLKNNQVLFKDYVLPFSDKINVDDTNNGLKSKWKGYNWIYKFPPSLEETEILDIENLNMTEVKFTIGVLERNGKVFMEIKERKMTNGVKIIDNEMPIMF